jgi:hypothetical protein
VVEASESVGIARIFLIVRGPERRYDFGSSPRAVRSAFTKTRGDSGLAIPDSGLDGGASASGSQGESFAGDCECNDSIRLEWKQIRRQDTGTPRRGLTVSCCGHYS